MFNTAVLTLLSFLAVVYGQQIGTSTAEVHPSLTWQKCTASGCTTTTGSVVLDSNWRWVHNTGGYTNCYTGNEWDTTLCPDPTTCAANCALDGAEYSATYGITTTGDSLTLAFETGSNVGSRVYLMESNTEYQMFQLLNQEFTFDVDVSNIGCGINGALYFSEMDADGGMAKYSGNKAGAQYGTGYCDSQCPRDMKFINGEANLLNWTSSSANSGTGSWGTCCNEMDVWEANSVSSAYTPHPCSVSGQTECVYGTNCTTLCDPAGCDFNSYRMGNTSFYGPGDIVDTNSVITVVTQFITNDGTATGTLSEIRRIYVQNGVVIQNSEVNIPGIPVGNSITTDYCTDQKSVFGDTNEFQTQGGLTAMGKAMGTGMVLVMSVWDDYAANMLWLDSDYPVGASASSPGVARGTCATTSGVPADVESQQASATVTFSNIKFGTLNSTYSGTTGTGTGTGGGTGSSSTAPSRTTTSSAPSATQSHYGQCGGTGWTGPTTCASGYTCQAVSPPYYSQCL
ncbi:cellulase [Hygrophoropsis aurantiaca]|uniref:Cellulase n=1 Tax=Hygrophoropsis aurantiaca TaxID=72124 RepID=A0ACB8AN79_9AGAM|nr:cellulase [Hygrophoropsis aurantiaca]